MASLIRSALGELVDMASLSEENQATIAVTGGGVAMNARGDILGPGGKVIRKAEEVQEAYNKSDPKAVTQVSLKGAKPNADVVNPARLEAQEIVKTRIAPRATDAFGMSPDIDPDAAEPVSLEEAKKMADEQLANATRRRRKTTEE